jgi:predicted Ser/Thr protein kinase
MSPVCRLVPCGESELDLLRKDPRSHRKEDTLQVEDLLPVISFGSKKNGETEKKHGEFVARIVARGYTERQVRRLVEWCMRVKQAG